MCSDYVLNGATVYSAPVSGAPVNLLDQAIVAAQSTPNAGVAASPDFDSSECTHWVSETGSPYDMTQEAPKDLEKLGAIAEALEYAPALKDLAQKAVSPPEFVDDFAHKAFHLALSDFAGSVPVQQAELDISNVGNWDLRVHRGPTRISVTRAFLGAVYYVELARFRASRERNGIGDELSSRVIQTLRFAFAHELAHVHLGKGELGLEKNEQKADACALKRLGANGVRGATTVLECLLEGGALVERIWKREVPKSSVDQRIGLLQQYRTTGNSAFDALELDGC